MLSRLDLQPALAYCTVTGRRRSRRYSDILSHNNLNLSSSQVSVIGPSLGQSQAQPSQTFGFWPGL